MEQGIPNFAELLAPELAAIPARALPTLLAGLEQAAAARYREWAEHFSGAERVTLLECAARELEIAERAAKVLPSDPADRAQIEATLPRARERFLAVYRDLPVREQLRIQAGAELQGAQAWRGMLEQAPNAAVRAELEACARLEEEGSAAVRELLARTATPQRG